MQETIFIRDLATVLLVATCVGWGAQRLGLSAVVGYLLAGLLIGPFSPAVKIVSNVDHIQLLSQVGLIFLMFAIGLGLSFARLQRMGWSILGAVVISSILLFNVCRWFGSAMGWNTTQIVFLAGTVMISSSAIIIKALDELNIMHQRAGQLALGITVLEDIVAVVMLALFISIVKAGASEAGGMGSVLGGLSAFVVFLVIVAMLCVPRLLRGLSREANSELRVVAVTGLVLLAALSAFQAGYSFALGAFVMGVVVAGTRYKDEMETAFTAMHTIFGSIFFVAVGMMFDYRLIGEAWGLVLAVSALTIVARPLACAFGLVAVGHSSKDAARAGLSLTPIGEFSFVMIQVGKSTNVLPEKFYAMSIGVALVTAVIGPLLAKKSDSIVGWVEEREPKPLRDMVAFYHSWLESLHTSANASLLWRLISRRVMLTGVHLLFVSALILFSRPLHEFARAHFLSGSPGWFGLIFWTTFGVVLLGPIIILWRNMEALAMIVADGASQRTPRPDLFRPALELFLKFIAAIVLLAWLLLLAPVGLWTMWKLLIAAIIVLLYLPKFWRRLVSIHGKIEVTLRDSIRTASTLGASTGLPASVLEQPQRWDLQIDEVTLPLASEHAGRRIAELAIRKRLGCSIMTIERNGYLITNPTADEKLYSGDKLLLLGTPEQLAKTEQFLRGAGSGRSDALADLAMEPVQVPEGSALAGKTLAEINPVGGYCVQVCAIQRNGARILVPTSTEPILPGDTLLALGRHEDVQSFTAALLAPAL